MKKILLKAASILTSVFFISSGIYVPASFAAVNELTLNDAQQSVPTLTLEQATAQAPDMQSPIPSGSAITESGPLSLPVPGDTDSSKSSSQPILDRPSITSAQGYEYERYEFDDAVELIRKEFASAVIVKGLSAEDLKKLAELPVETGVIVLHGEVVLFTSGSADEVSVLPAAKELLGKAAFVSHTHTNTLAVQGPSGADLNRAQDRTEYVITRDGVYAYDKHGVLNNGKPLGFDEYLAQLNGAVTASGAEKDQIEVRKDLNQFIKSQDDYNRAAAEEHEIFRMGGTLSYTSGLTTANVTTLPGSPLPYITAGSVARTTLSYSSNQFLLGYNVTGAMDVSGFTVSFDNATTPEVETQNISALSQLVFGLRGPNTSLVLEAVDFNDNKDTFTLTNISSTIERFWSVPVSAIANTVDKTKIKQLNFIVTQANTTSTTRTGTLYIRTSGLNTNAPSQPAVTSALPPATRQTAITLFGTKEANTSILINGVQAVARDAATTWTATANLTIEGNNTLSITAKNSIGKLSPVNTITLKRDTIIPAGSVNINTGALYTTSQTVTLNLSSTDSGSGLGAMSFSTDNANWTAPEVYATSKVFTLPAGDGAKTVYVKYYDQVGNVSAVYSKSIILDTLLPSGTIAVNGGAQFIKQTLVTLNLAAADTGSGLSKMSFSSNNVTWTAVENYAVAKTWAFAAGDGNKTVAVKFQDKSGKWSTPVSVTVLLDMVKPTGSIMINSGAAFTSSRDVTLDLSVTDAGSGISTMSFSTNNVNWTAAEAYAASKSFTLPAGDGAKTVYVRYFDKAGNVSATYYKTISLDTVVTAGSISINSGALYATSQAVTLNLSASDTLSGIDKMSFSTDNTNWTTPETYATSKAFNLPAGDGTKTVYVRYYDKIGNVSVVYSRSIILDTLLPSGTITVNGGAQFIKQTLVTLNLAAADTGSGLSKMSFSSDNVTWTAAEAYAATKAWTFAAGDGNKTVYAKFRDKAGNWSTPVSVTVLLDMVKPTGSIMVNSGAAFTSSRDVTLDLSVTDAGSGISTMSFSTNNVNWTAAEAYAASKSFTLPAGDGAKTVYVRYFDKAGNVSVTYYKTISLDTVVPAGSININAGAQYANSQGVTLNLSATDVTSKIDKMSFSTDNTNWTTPETYATSKAFTLPAGDGAKTVYVKYYDKAGNISAVYSKTIILDTVVPTLTPFDLPADGRTDIPYFVIPVQVDDTNSQNAIEYITVSLSAGVNQIPITIQDKAGNGRQITVNLEYVAPDVGLTTNEKALRKQWIDANSKYFIAGQGIDSKTGFPIDVIGPNAPAVSKWTQPTSIGFYLQLLADVITKRVELSSLTQQAALAAAEKTLTSLLDAQTRFGWKGLIPWLRLDGTLRPDNTRIGLIDNANLSHEIAIFIGLFEAGNLEKTVAASLVQKAQTFLDLQGEGYRSFVDPASGVLRGVFDQSSNRFDNYADRFGSEIRATVPFLIEYFNLPDSVWTNLIRSTSDYPTLQGRTVETFSAFDGGAFQYFWPLLVSPEDQLPNIREALQNALLIFNDWMERNHLAGFPSASSIPEGGYNVNLGIDFLKETTNAISGNYAAVYGLASAYRLDPSWVIAKLQAIQTAFPALKGTLGFYDAMRSDGAVSRNYYAIDQGSFVLGLLGTGADDFRSFMEKRGLWNGYQDHYAALDLNIQQAVEGFPEPPLTPAEIQRRTPDTGNLYSGNYDYDQLQGNGISVSETSPGIYTYHKITSYSWVGGFVTPAFNRNDYNYVTLEARSLANGSNSFVFEVKKDWNYLLQKTISLQGTDWHTFQFFFPKDTDPVNFIAFSNPTNDFEVRNLMFSDAPVFTGPLPAQVIQTSSSFSNTLDYQLLYSINGVPAQEALRLNEGNNTITRTWINTFGEKVTRIFSIQADTVVPAGSININAGAQYANSQSVTLNLSANDATSGIDKMSFSTDNVNWTVREAYATSKAFTLPAGDGAKTVYVKYYDKAGNVSSAYSKSIVLDTTAPTGSITINSGAGYASSTSVTLNLSASDALSGIDKMSFSTNNSTWTTPQVYAASKTLVVPSGDGTKTVYVRYYDKLGNVSGVYSASIILDTVAPILSSVTAVNTSSNGVTISWLTNEAADTMIEYGLTTSYGQSTVLDPALAASHSQSVNGLVLNTLYHYRIKSKDAAGNLRVSGDLTFTVQISVPAQASIVYTQTGDRRLFVQNRRPDGTLEPTVAFVAKGVNWSPASAGTDPNADSGVFQKEFQKWYQTDIPLMAQMGINVVRVYHDFGTGPNAIKILDELYRYGIKVIVAVDSPLSNVSGDINNISTIVNAYKNHPAILMWAIGNEWDVNRYYGKFTSLQDAANFTEQAAQLIKSLDPNHPVTTLIGDPHMPGVHPLSPDQFPYLSGPYTSDIVNTMVPSVDVWGVNIYRGSSFQDVSQQWRSISQKPMFIGEFGADSYDHRTGSANPAMQATMDSNLWDETFFDLSAERTAGTVIGALGFEWNDEWWKNGSPSSHTVTSEQNGGQPDGYNDEEWFGIVDINRNPKTVYTQLQNKFVNGPSSVVVDPTPVIQVTSQDGGGATKFGIDSKTVFYRQGGQYGGRGISVAILDPHTGIRMQEVRTFDTWYMSGGWGGPHVNFPALVNYLNSLPNGTIYALSIADEGGFRAGPGNGAWNDPNVEAAYQALESLGSTMIRNVGYQGGWAMIGIKGQGKLAEAYSAPLALVTIQAQVSITPDPDFGRR